MNDCIQCALLDQCPRAAHHLFVATCLVDTCCCSTSSPFRAGPTQLTHGTRTCREIVYIHHQIFEVTVHRHMQQIRTHVRG
jgi:hypothetical protein